eukprot:6756181-Prymnesium_polylepis.1
MPITCWRNTASHVAWAKRVRWQRSTDANFVLEMKINERRDALRHGDGRVELCSVNSVKCTSELINTGYVGKSSAPRALHTYKAPARRRVQVGSHTPFSPKLPGRSPGRAFKFRCDIHLKGPCIRSKCHHHLSNLTGVLLIF